MFYRPAEGHGLPHDPFKALVAPRPIGWIGTLDLAGRANLAPYSFFNACGEAPPLVMFAQSGAKAADAIEKDTIANIRARGEFTASIVGEAQAQAMSRSSAILAAGEDEFDHAGLAKAPSVEIAPPWVRDAPAALECRLVRVIDDLPARKPGWRNVMVIGEVVGVHIDEAVLAGGLVDVTRYRPVARLGYMDYATVTATWPMKRG